MSRSTSPAFGIVPDLKSVLRICIVAVLATLGFAPHASVADVDGADFLIWQRNFGVAATETAELAILNTCNKTVRLSWKALSGEPPFKVTEAADVIVLRPSTSAVVPIPFPPTAMASGRRHVELVVNGEPTPCVSGGRKSVLLSLAILDQQAAVLHFSGLRSDGDLVQAAPDREAKRIGRNRGAGMRLVRMGTDQDLEVSVFNRCRGDVKFKLLAQALGGSDDPIAKKVSLAAGDGSVIPLPEFEDTWVAVQGTFRPQTTAACRRGRVDASAAVYSSNDGGTAEISLLLPAVQAARE